MFDTLMCMMNQNRLELLFPDTSTQYDLECQTNFIIHFGMPLEYFCKAIFSKILNDWQFMNDTYYGRTRTTRTHYLYVNIPLKMLD